MDDPEVLDFIRHVFFRQLSLTVGWQESGYALMLRYEQFMIDVESTIKDLYLKLGITSSYELFRASLSNHEREYYTAINPLSDLRIPYATLGVLNEIIPPAFFKLGYRRQQANAHEHMRKCMLGMAEFQKKYSERQRVFLIGHGKSGTTWLHMLFFHHPNAAVVAERRLFEHPDQNDALFDSFLDNSFFENWFNSSSFGIQTPEQKIVRYELMRLISDYLFYRALALRKTSKGFERKNPITHFSEKIALNTAPDATVAITAIKNLYPEAKVIHIVRDPRDVAVSAMFHSYRNFLANRERNWITSYIESALKGEREGVLKNKALLAYFNNYAKSWNKIVGIFHNKGKNLFGDNYIVVRYEDLLRETNEHVGRLFEFVGLRHERELVADIVEKASFKRLTKGRKTGEQDSLSFYRKGVAGDWKNYITVEESRKVFDKALELMKMFGYYE